jgi:hypothetical protein
VIEDGDMLPGMGLTAVDHLADVEAFLEEMRQGAHAVRTATLGAPAREGADLRHDVSAGEFLGERPDRAAFEVEPEHGADGLGLLGHDADPPPLPTR